MTTINWKRIVFIAIIWWAVCNQGVFEGQSPEGAIGTYPVPEVVAMAGDTLTVKIQEENTKPTNGLIFFHLLGSGAVCSADNDTAFTRLLRRYDDQSVMITLAPAKPREQQRLAPR